MFSQCRFFSTFAAETVTPSFLKEALNLPTTSRNHYYSVTDFGAAGDGQTPSAYGFQKALDEAEKMEGAMCINGEICLLMWIIRFLTRRTFRINLKPIVLW